MSQTPVYGITHLQNHSANPEIVVNGMFDAFEEAFNATRAWTITTDTTATQAQLAEAHLHVLGGSPVGAFDFNLPAGIPRRFAVRNTSGQTATVQVTGGAGANVAVLSGTMLELHSDGTDVRALDSTSGLSTGLAWDFGFNMPGGPPIVDELLGKVMIARDIVVAADMAGSLGHIDTDPTAAFAVDVRDDGVSIGTISISTGGVFTFTTAGNTAKAVAAGSVIRFVAPDPADATAAGLAVTIAASRA